MNAGAALILQSVSRSFGGVVAVRDVSLEVKRGELLGVIGPNSSGKTTLLNIVCGFVKPDTGKVILEGKNVTAAPPHVRAGMGVGRLFQDVRVFGRLTVMENMLLAANDRAEEGVLTALVGRGRLKRTRSEALERARHWLEFVGLEAREDAPALSLSYGQRKLLAIAMLLVRDSKVLLLDEPIAGLDMRMRDSLLNLALKLKGLGKAVVVIEHSLDFVFDVSDRVILFKDGGKFHEGSADEVRLATPVLRGAYLISHAGD